MQDVQIVSYQVIILGLIALVGFISGKTGYLPPEAGSVLSAIVIKLTSPLLVFTTISQYRYTSQTLHDGALIYGISIILILFAYLMAKILYRALKFEKVDQTIYKMASVFGNVVFLAYPLLNSLYGDKGIFYAIFFNLANDTILWTWGIYLLNTKTGSWREQWKGFVNGNTIAVVAGFLCICFHLQTLVEQYPLVHSIYQLLYAAMNPLGKTTTYLAMVFIGLILAESRTGHTYEPKEKAAVICLSACKLLVVPVLSLIGLRLFLPSLDPFIIKIVILQLAMPTATIMATLADQYQSDYRLATECIFVTTLLSMGTLPLMLYLLKA